MGETVGHVIRIDPRYPGAWVAVSPYLAKALEIGGSDDWNLDDIQKAALTGAVQLWAIVKMNSSPDQSEVFGSCVTIETYYPRRKVLEVLVLGTEPHTDDLWLGAFEELKALAKANECSAVLGTGRPGWAKKLGGTERRIVEVAL